MIWPNSAVRALHRLDRAVSRRVIVRLEEAVPDPDLNFVEPVGSDEFKLRVGVYRPIALSSHSEQTMLVERVGYRSQISK
jgi:hypothetical protein